jgi:two-component system KDP operon response regulator KdpE
MLHLAWPMVRWRDDLGSGTHHRSRANIEISTRSNWMNQEKDRKKRILVVDDEPRIGRFLSLHLGLSGYKTITVISGAEALEIVPTQNPDLILLDIVMPGMDGFRVLETLRTFSKLPVIAFSATSENGPKALELGANYFLTKPFGGDDMVRIVNRILDHEDM